MPGSVNDIDLMVTPPGGRRRALDGDSPFLFLGHPVHGRFAVVYLAYTVYLLGIK